MPGTPSKGVFSGEQSRTENGLSRDSFDERDEISRLQSILAQKSWIGFDLDDTLHEFRRASSKAVDSVLSAISQRYQTPESELRAAYSTILREKTSNAFSDGKTSFDYRRERFTALVTKFSIPPDDAFLEELLGRYEATLMDSLELMDGTITLLSTIRSCGKKIMVITEGPQDAQERTVKGLGIDKYIDYLATTNHFRAPKVGGLFPKVLEDLKIPPGDMAYVGDSEDRDMKPAMAAGIFSIHYDKNQHSSFKSSPPRVKSLQELVQAFIEKEIS
ncbi:uncharacterized protein DNG_02341 [Cephalotrichum gorgonifer]|uniref:Uncharacterized protein n=1 Tax=Cephalotrichum gorgonifer TaxID=2041049 RepID=A0AAE8MT40_9PEZI|nr:uncharacterized protein DNG_02341 [Cephalotrichum gorgonifer]